MLTGIAWQQIIDELPVNETFDSADIGVPPQVVVTIPGFHTFATVGSLVLSTDESTVFNLWADRNVKPYTDFAFAQNGHLRWEEMPRSDWYAYVEARKPPMPASDVRTRQINAVLTQLGRVWHAHPEKTFAELAEQGHRRRGHVPPRRRHGPPRSRTAAT